MAEQIDVVIPVFRPDEKLERLIRQLNSQTRKPGGGTGGRRFRKQTICFL